MPGPETDVYPLSTLPENLYLRATEI